MALSPMLRIVVVGVLFVGSVVTTDVTSSASNPLELSRQVAAGAAHSLAIEPP